MSSHNNNESLSESAPVLPARATSVKFPWIVWVWSAIKTFIELSVSIVSFVFIVQSGFFNPFGYDASVWSREALYSLCLPIAIFETVDLCFSVWITLYLGTRELPLIPIIHHLMVAIYAYYVYALKDSLSLSFLGLFTAAASGEVIAFLYTLQHLRFRFRYLALCLLCVQLLYRTPLSVVFCLRTIQYFWECPWIHYVICVTVLLLDLRWTKWAFKLNYRLQEQHRMKKMKLHQANPTKDS